MSAIVLSLLVASSLEASALDASVTFVSSFGPYRVTVREHCEWGPCGTIATVERFGEESPNLAVCSVDTVAFPRAEILASRWELVQALRVRKSNGEQAAEAKFHPYPDCTSVLSVQSDDT
jgi:uncharacterized small protein (DUF1192 family)